MLNILSLLGWSFLPNLVTGWVQAIYYGITIRAGEAKPQPGTPRYAEHRRRIHILVVSVYLAYTIYEADYELQRAGSFYGDLGVGLDATDREIKSRFRRLAATFHPDKVGKGGGDASADMATDPDAVNTYFIHLKTASDTLLDPARRFAYDRFGPAAVGWGAQRCKTVRDYVTVGGQVLLAHYGVSAAALYGLGLLGYMDWGRYERWLAMAALFAFEAHTMTRPGRPAVIDKLLNPLLAFFAGSGTRVPYLPFQAITLARQLSITLSIALMQIGPLLTADTSGGQIATRRHGGGGGAGENDAALRQGLDRLEAAAKGLDSDSSRLLEMEMAPYAGDGDMLAAMRGKVKEWLVQNTIRGDPMVRDALGRSLTKRRVDAPAGARGTR
ncbi:hypothetical protein B0T24DRAFT_263507 [Lasiosphaeria ovina]|uniref:J domain-containing protein n=1 Tax=Lasiosphaeria ovina TaxID=92902 RepID=A0AAE0KC71_9PEZI|nr:hypothetical protein B0T24DRAFT_263507 [Lasiosphaeria ovina]